MWTVRLLTKRGVPLAWFTCHSEDGARSLFIDMKMTGAFVRPAHCLILVDPSNACIESHTIAAFIGEGVAA